VSTSVPPLAFDDLFPRGGWGNLDFDRCTKPYVTRFVLANLGFSLPVVVTLRGCFVAFRFIACSHVEDFDVANCRAPLPCVTLAPSLAEV